MLQGYICQGDALMTMDQIDAAEKSYAMALELEPSLRRSKSFKVWCHLDVLVHMFIKDVLWPYLVWNDSDSEIVNYAYM